MQFISLIGGLFSLAVFWHFVADWFPQSHQEAMTKTRDPEVRAWHCLKYTLIFMIPVIWVGLGGPGWLGFVNAIILCSTHYVIDSYVPVLLWAKYLRKHPTFAFSTHHDGSERAFTDKEAFKEMALTPIGLILIITMDQLFHIAALIPVVVLIALYAL